MTAVRARECFHNVGGYSDVGKLTWPKHTTGIVSGLTAPNPHAIHLVELSGLGEPDQFSTISAKLEAWGRRTTTAPNEGRFSYLRDDMRKIAAGRASIPSEYRLNGDDKPLAWTAWSLLGRPALSIAWHAEHEKGDRADELRFLSTWWTIRFGMLKADELGIPRANVAVFADLNSHSYVVDRLYREKGWKSAAKGGADEDTSTFRGWDGQYHKRFDYCLVKRGVAAGVDVQRTTHSDHSRLVCWRELV